MIEYTKNWFKLLTGFGLCLLLRLIPFRPPNIEPILATQMPFSKAYGRIAGFSFAFLSIFLYDVITGKVGQWTFVTAFAYGLLAFWASVYFKNKDNKPITYAKFAIMGTLVYDAVTGLSIGPIFFGQPFMEALVGQIPFTAMHLFGNTALAVFISPAIYKFVIQNKKLETGYILNILKIKKV